MHIEESVTDFLHLVNDMEGENPYNCDNELGINKITYFRTGVSHPYRKSLIWTHLDKIRYLYIFEEV